MPTIDAILDEIKEFFALPRAPALFERIAAHEGYLRTSWKKYQTVMLTGQLKRLTKELVAVAVSAVNACFY